MAIGLKKSLSDELMTWELVQELPEAYDELL